MLQLIAAAATLSQTTAVDVTATETAYDLWKRERDAFWHKVLGESMHDFLYLNDVSLCSSAKSRGNSADHDRNFAFCTDILRSLSVCESKPEKEETESEYEEMTDDEATSESEIIDPKDREIKNLKEKIHELEKELKKCD